MKILLLLGIVFGATSGSAGERLFWDSERNSRIVVADSEELGVFNVDVFEKKGTTLQQRVSHQEFQSAEVRDRALQALLEKYNQTQACPVKNQIKKRCCTYLLASDSMIL
ncbi:hypothetical protein K2X30_15355, partial [bacterium]|nr:hypothetical protein [bacterium]